MQYCLPLFSVNIRLISLPRSRLNSSNASVRGGGVLQKKSFMLKNCNTAKNLFWKTTKMTLKICGLSKHVVSYYRFSYCTWLHSGPCILRPPVWTEKYILWRLCVVRAAWLSRGFGSSARTHLLLPVRPLSRHTLSKRRDRHAPRVRLLQES